MAGLKSGPINDYAFNSPGEPLIPAKSHVSGFQPLKFVVGPNLGLRPRLVWNEPLAFARPDFHLPKQAAYLSESILRV
jgi:hypothetical protein